MSDFYLKKGDRLPIIECVLKDGNGAPINLTGATVKFRMATTGAVEVFETSATVVSATEGSVSYSWGATDTTTAGEFLGEWIVTSSGLTQTVPNGSELRIHIRETVS